MFWMMCTVCAVCVTSLSLFIWVTRRVIIVWGYLWGGSVGVLVLSNQLAMTVGQKREERQFNLSVHLSPHLLTTEHNIIIPLSVSSYLSPHRWWSSCGAHPCRSCCCRQSLSFGLRSSCRCSACQSRCSTPNPPPRLATACSSHGNRERWGREGRGRFVTRSMYTGHHFSFDTGNTQNMSLLLQVNYQFIVWTHVIK